MGWLLVASIHRRLSNLELLHRSAEFQTATNSKQVATCLGQQRTSVAVPSVKESDRSAQVAWIIHLPAGVVMNLAYCALQRRIELAVAFGVVHPVGGSHYGQTPGNFHWQGIAMTA